MKIIITVILFVFSFKAASQNNDSIRNEKPILNLDKIDTHPSFPGGPGKMYKFINENLKIPSDAPKTERKIFVRFVVEIDGTLSNIELYKKDIDPIISNEIIRVLKLSPNWNAGKLNGEKIRVLYGMPINIY
ncbi:energy transducer TonB [Flavobacterium caeni]|uniref:hypothetical protein n=1 Tax=Flavobacterium caeni TaxID=490189 RepID=UPI0011130468|nr:hypothetical protein [Flavobacterium caeni]